MASLTPATVNRYSAGSNTLNVATFSNIDNADLWDSTLQSVVAYWTNATDDPTQTKEKIDVAYVLTPAAEPSAKGRFTFSTGENARVGTLYFLAKT